jgi:hypothetical protein
MIRFIVKGKERGVVSKHRSINAAVKSLVKDNQDCDAAGGCSDVCIYINISGSGEYLVPLDINENDCSWRLDEWGKEVPKYVRKFVEEWLT